MLVANHSSYLDSLALVAAIPRDCRFVANHLAATRPLLGLIIRKSGHLVVDRASRQSRAACARAMIALLQDGTSLVLFPEGTLGQDVLPFHAGGFGPRSGPDVPSFRLRSPARAASGRGNSVFFAAAPWWCGSCPPFTRPPTLRSARCGCGTPPPESLQPRCDRGGAAGCSPADCTPQHRQHPPIRRPVLDLVRTARASSAAPMPATSRMKRPCVRRSATSLGTSGAPAGTWHSRKFAHPGTTSHPCASRPDCSSPRSTAVSCQRAR